MTGCYVGAADADHPHLVHARYVHHGAHPAAMIPALCRIYATVGYDTTALITVVLRYDWEHLDAAASTSGLSGRHLVPGVGAPLVATGADSPEPVCVFPLAHAAALDIGWIYLLDPDNATVTVHADDGDPIGAYPLGRTVPAPAALHPAAPTVKDLVMPRTVHARQPAYPIPQPVTGPARTTTRGEALE